MRTGGAGAALRALAIVLGVAAIGGLTGGHALAAGAVDQLRQAGADYTVENLADPQPLLSLL